jgi:hypothetical protein
MKSCRILPLLALLGLSGAASAIQIEIRYDYDTAGFFNNPDARAAMEAVADFYEPLIHDSLAAIDVAAWPGYSWQATFTHPGNGTTNFAVPNLVVPANTIIVFAGARTISSAGLGGFGGWGASGNQAWFDLIQARGEAGALATPKTDFGPWGGAITFDPNRTWNFSLVDPSLPGTPFLPIALHELGHVLGLGTAPSWTAKISSGTFTGARAVQAYGGNVPLQSGGGHWRDNTCGGTDGYLAGDANKVLSKAYGSFASPHGYAQVALMDPSVCTNGSYQKVMTDLDLAALRDIGWELEPPAVLNAPNLDPVASPFVFSWPSTSGFTYELQRSPSLAGDSWTPLSTQAGNGDLQQFSTPAPGLPAAFYRLTVDAPVAAAPLFMTPATPAPSHASPVEATGCGCGSH